MILIRRLELVFLYFITAIGLCSVFNSAFAEANFTINITNNTNGKIKISKSTDNICIKDDTIKPEPSDPNPPPDATIFPITIEKGGIEKITFSDDNNIFHSHKGVICNGNPKVLFLLVKMASPSSPDKITTIKLDHELKPNGNYWWSEVTATAPDLDNGSTFLDQALCDSIDCKGSFQKMHGGSTYDLTIGYTPGAKQLANFKVQDIGLGSLNVTNGFGKTINNSSDTELDSSQAPFTFNFSKTTRKCYYSNTTLRITCDTGIGFKYVDADNTVVFFCSQIDAKDHPCPWLTNAKGAKATLNNWQPSKNIFS
ncbi:hypothetical protein L3V82_05440 [Thiotrichales bacterium 19S3-7]|nr:hypothetical protein [Thiotrichales bacterium 19S3-7]MCF6801537.1 hypothetical protein [Thiotrichales bacterium 19S3-11]